MNIAKLAYKGPHERNFRDHLKLCHKIITWNLRRKKIQGNTTELGKRTIFESEYEEVLNNLPIDVRSGKSFSSFRDKSFKFSDKNNLPEQFVWIQVCQEIPISEDSYRNQPIEWQCGSIYEFLTSFLQNQIFKQSLFLSSRHRT